jgi:hypothetical protein
VDVSEYPHNICEYMRYVLSGIFWAVIGSVMGLGVITIILSGIIYPIIHLFTGYTNEAGKVFTMIDVWLVILTAAFVVTGFVKSKLEQRREARVAAPPGFVKSAWRSFKDKTCVRIEFKS